ncbi:hypothetical protein LguiA_017289 [Lonicera macranthoides]
MELAQSLAGHGLITFLYTKGQGEGGSGGGRRWRWWLEVERVNGDGGCGLVQTKRHNNKRLRLINEHNSPGGGGEEEDEEEVKKKKKKRKINYFINNNQLYKWEELPKDVLQSILDQLSLGDYATFGAVSRACRSLYVECKLASLASKPPILFMVTKGSKRSCHFVDIFRWGIDVADSNSKTVLPYADSIYCDTFCCGYLIARVRKMHQLWLINPITRNIYRFPYAEDPLNRVIIASSSSRRPPWPCSPDALVIVGVSMSQEYVHFYLSSDAKWTMRKYGNEPGEIVDIVNFKGKIYFLTRSADIGTINLPTAKTSQDQDQEDQEVLVRLEVNKGPNPPPSASLNGYYLELVASDERLMMLVFLRRKVVSVYEFDFSKMEWGRVEERFGGDDDDQAIFTGYLSSLAKSSALVKNPSRWGGRRNCIYSFDSKANCSVYSLDGQVLQTFPGPSNLRPAPFPVWYFPHQYKTCGTIDSLDED